VIIENAGHNTIGNTPGYWVAIHQFLSETAIR